MAQKSIKVSLTAEITEPDGGNLRRNSGGNPSSPYSEQNIPPLYRRSSVASCHDGGISRRNSTGKPSFSNNEEKNILPRYLRASTGSCHDFCKYGRKHAFEVKARDPIPKRITKPPSDNKQNNIGIVIPVERKKTTVVKVNPSLDSKTHSPSPPEIIKREIMLPSKKVEASSKQDSSNNKKMKEKEMKTILSLKRSPSAKPKPATVKSSSSFNASVGLNGRRKGDIKFGKKMDTSKATVKKALAPPTASLSPKPSVGRAMSLNARNYRALKLVSPQKDQNMIRKAEPKQPNNDEVQEKTLHVVEVKTENRSLESVQIDDIIKSQSLLSPKASSHPNSSSLSSHGEDLEESEYTDSEADEFESENDEIVSIDELETSKGNHNRTPRKVGMVLSEDKEALGKSKFRRGRVVDLQCENNGPRRLRFRRGRVLGYNEEGKRDARKKFKKRGVDNDANGTSPSSEKVILKHQDVQQGKKDAQGLFNNVIEETASKLVESRKSKVKALVGDFETVISLQESKPSTPTAT